MARPFGYPLKLCHGASNLQLGTQVLYSSIKTSAAHVESLTLETLAFGWWVRILFHAPRLHLPTHATMNYLHTLCHPCFVMCIGDTVSMPTPACWAAQVPAAPAPSSKQMVAVNRALGALSSRCCRMSRICLPHGRNQQVQNAASLSAMWDHTYHDHLNITSLNLLALIYNIGHMCVWHQRRLPLMRTHETIPHPIDGAPCNNL